MRKIIAANWKMHKNQFQAKSFAESLKKSLEKEASKHEIFLFAPFTLLENLQNTLQSVPNVSIGAQNCYPALEGAYTGEISPLMLKELGCTWTLAGHSERRQYFAESPEFVGEKTAFALAEGLNAMLCIGENLEQRKDGRLEAVLTDQLEKGLAKVPAGVSPENLAIAYEPVWAIGTGQVAGKEDVLETHALVRKILFNILGKNGENLRLLYGGSVKPDNAEELLGLDNVDGLLIGGASLDFESFEKIFQVGS